MSFLLPLLNVFSTDRLFIFLFLFFFLSTLYIFLSTESLFFQLTLTLIFIILSAILLSRNSLDFFGGFLLTAELPILLVCYFFFFHKNSLSFDNLYTLTKKPFIGSIFAAIFVILYICSFSTNVAEHSFFEFSFFDSIYLPHRNDFFLYYTFYYVTYPLFTVLLGFLIFLLSYIVIVLYYLSQYNQKTTLKTKSQFSFIRKQNFLRQATFNSKLSFFKKK